MRARLRRAQPRGRGERRRARAEDSSAVNDEKGVGVDEEAGAEDEGWLDEPAEEGGL